MQPVGGIDYSHRRQPPLLSTPFLLFPAFSQVVETLQPAGVCLDPSPLHRAAQDPPTGWAGKEEAVCSARSLGRAPFTALSVDEKERERARESEREREREAVRVSDRESAREKERESNCVTEGKRTRQAA